jgi:hypothetical protein
MQRLFAREIRDQRQQIQGLLNAVPEPVPEHSMTMMAPLLGTSATLSGSLRGTQVSSVTDLMDELTRQRRTTTRLLGGLLLLVAFALIFGVYWTLVLRPAQTEQSAANLLASKQAQAATASRLTDARTPAAEAAASQETPAAATVEASAKSGSGSGPTRHSGKPMRTAPVATPSLAPAPPPAAPMPSPPPPAAAAEVGYLNLDTTPWSTVSVGGRVLGQTPIVGASLPAGTHTLVLSNPEQGVRTTYQVTISAGKTTARRIGLD